MVDISGLSFLELMELEMAVQKAKKKKEQEGEALWKCQLAEGRLFEMLEQRFPIEKYPANLEFAWVGQTPNEEKYYYTTYAGDLMSRYRKSLLTICDATLGNYELKNRKTVFRGSLIRENAELYKAMYHDIVDLILKYNGKCFGEEKTNT